MSGALAPYQPTIHCGRLSDIVPFSGDSLLWLNGTIIENGGNYYLKDKSGNGRDFLITNYDWENRKIKGFPYKTAATISAPVGDATLIAADINNFLYDSSGNPNNIPVVSFFKDIDYEHKLFCKHSGQVLDVITGVEMSEPFVKHIVLYNNVKGGDDLVKCQSYYVVPTEEPTAIWVSKNGDDANTGTKESPYLTINKAYDNVSDGDTMYIKSGNFVATNSTRTYWRVEKAINVIGLGYSILDNTDTTYMINVLGSGENATFKGFVIDNDSIHATWTLGLQIGCTFNFCKINKGASYSCRNLSTTSTITYKNCVFVAPKPFEQTYNVELSTSYINTTASYSIISLGVIDSSIILNHNIFKIEAGGNVIYTNEDNAKIVVFDNVITITSTMDSILLQSSNVNDTLSFTYNKIETSVVFNNSNTLGIIYGTKYNSVDINNNVITLSETTMEGIIINLTSTDKINIEKNIITTSQTGKLMHFRSVINDSGYTSSSIVVNNNKSISNGSEDMLYFIGSDGATAYDDTISGIIFKDNYFENKSGNANNAIFVGFQKDSLITRNHLVNWGHAIVTKHITTNIFDRVISYNIVYNGSILMFGIPNGVVNNNSLYLDKDIVIQAINVSNNGGADPNNCIVKNNVVHSTNTSSTHYMMKVDLATGLDIDSNFYYQEGKSSIFDINSVDKTWAEWNLQGFDNNGTNGTDPLWADFIPSSSSLLIGNGVDLGSNYRLGLDGSTDWKNDSELPNVITKLQGNSWDIGAYVNSDAEYTYLVDENGNKIII